MAKKSLKESLLSASSELVNESDVKFVKQVRNKSVGTLLTQEEHDNFITVLTMKYQKKTGKIQRISISSELRNFVLKTIEENKEFLEK